MKQHLPTPWLNVAIWLLLIFFTARGVTAGDWPTYMHDGSRAGVTDEAAHGPFVEHWTYHAPTAPRPAWPSPQVGWTELPKVAFDDASYAVADADTVYFGSTSENCLYAIDAVTGVTRWKFFTSGAVRLAPTLANGKVYFGSDDGRVYCVNRNDGTQAWAFNAARDNTLVLANGQVASLWAVHTNVLVEGDRAYVGAGVFPYHEVAAYALDSNTGAVIWKNAKVEANGGFSPQGYLVAMRAGVVFLTGRALPVCLNRENGNVVFSVPKSVEKGMMTGDYGVAYNGILFTGTQNVLASTNEKGEAGAKVPDTAKIMPTADSVYTLRGPLPPRGGTNSTSTAGNTITASSRGKASVDGAPAVKGGKRWTYARPGLASMILAGNAVFAGADDSVVSLDAANGKELWVGKVDGTAVGLAYAHGRLIVSTNKGHVYCFAAGAAPAKAARPAAPVADAALTATVKAVVKEAGVARGFALVLGKDAVDFACELARQSEFQITCVEPDAGKLSAARKRVDAAGLYGHRVTVETGTPDSLPFPDFAGNLVVQLDASIPPGGASRELLDSIKPCGGVLLTRSTPDLSTWREMGSVAPPLKLAEQSWTKFVRGELPGSGWWTHQYADAGNSGSSGDTRLKGRLGVLWYGEPGGDEAPDRHTRGSAPLLLNGRVFAQGIRYPDKTYVYSYDAYNGVRYWEREIPNAVRAGIPGVPGNLACNADSVFVAAGAECFRIDAITGEVRAKYAVPNAGAVWGFLSVADGVLLGSSAFAGRVSYSNGVFAYDLASNKLRWNMPTSEIRNTAIAYGSGRLFFAQDLSATEPLKTGMPGILPFPDVKKETDSRNAGRKKKAAAEKKKADDEHGDDDDNPDNDEPVDRLGKPIPKNVPVMRNVVAVDVVTGAKVWNRDVDLTDCGSWNAGVFGATHALCKGDVLLFAGAYTGYGRPKDDAPPKIGVALSTRDGTTFWSSPIDTRTRPIFMQNALLAEPLFFDVHSGKKLAQPAPGADPGTPPSPVEGKQREWTIGGRAGACGSLSASDSMVFGRSGITIWRSVTGAGGGGSFAGIRPGCMINIVPAGGVVVQAESSGGCVCTHSIQCTVVFRPQPAPGPAGPAKQ